MEDSNDVPADSNDSATNAKASQDGRTDAVKRPVGLAVLVMVVVLLIPVGLSVAAVAPWTVTRPIVTCTDLRSAATERSREDLKVNLTETIATTKAELNDIRAKHTENDRALAEDEKDLKSAQDDLQSAQDDLELFQATLTTEKAALDALRDDGDPSGESVKVLDESIALLTESVKVLDDAIASLTERIASLAESVVSLRVAIEALVQRRDVLLERFEAKYRARSALLTPAETEAELLWLTAEIAELKAQRTVVGKDLVRLKTDIEQLKTMVAILDESINGRFAFPAARANVNLVPADPVVYIELGGHRFPTMVQVPLESVSLGIIEDATVLPDDAGTVLVSTGELPDKAEFLTSAGQLRRNEDISIPEHEVMVWARRMDTFVMLSVCVTPDGLDAGQYAGDVYLLDPSLNPTKVRVEVTAQSPFINWLYVLLFLVPASALFYVWVNSRYTAGESPWKWGPFWNWLSQNAVIALVVGFAAVWAALQGPFNNPTWGSSLVGAVVVIGVGLVAAMTAMTVVAGRADQKGIDSPDKGDRGDDGVAVPGDKSDDLNQGS